MACGRLGGRTGNRTANLSDVTSARQPVKLGAPWGGSFPIALLLGRNAGTAVELVPNRPGSAHYLNTAGLTG